MHSKKQRGGKRAGAGRKPLENKKLQLSLYIERTTIDRYGGITQTRKVLENFLKHENDESAQR